MLALLLLALGVMLAPGPAALGANALVVGALGLAAPGSFRHLFRLLRRLRWVLLFILLFQGWLTPGPELLPAAGSWSPSLPGLGYALRLMGVVVLMAGIGSVLVRATPGPELAGGIAWVLAPLGRLGLPVERFGRRLAWTLDRVEPVQREVGRIRDALRVRLAGARGLRERIRMEAETGRMLLRRAGEAADRNAEALYLRGGGAVPRPGRPQGRDWALILFAGAWTLGLALAAAVREGWGGLPG